MERPRAETNTRQRIITGEIVYLDEMRRQNTSPSPFRELGDVAMQMYEEQAGQYSNGERPAIMDEYEQYDSVPSEIVGSCMALANELLALKRADSPFTFVDIVVEANPDTILTKLTSIAAGRILAGQNEQLAIPSDGEYYPILDMRKQKAKLVGVGLRVWGWDHTKCVFTNKEDEKYTYPQHALFYPADEKSSTRQLELSFGYSDEEFGGFSESVSLYLTDDGSASISRSVSAQVYAETGYEGHAGASLDNPTDEDVAALGDLIAEVVGDEPESVAMHINRQLQEWTDAAATPSAQQAIRTLIEETWPTQAHYFLQTTLKGADKTIAQLLRDETTVEAATAAVRTILEEWKNRAKG